MNKLDFQNREQLLVKFESWTEIPMLLLVVVLIITFTTPFIVTLPESISKLLEFMDGIIWAIFVVELAIRTYLSEKRLLYLKKHWIDVLVVILPFLRIFRVLRVVRMLRIYRLTKILVLFGKFTGEAKTLLSRYRFQYLLVILIGFIGIGAVLIYQFDQGLPGGNETLADALWMAIVNAISGGFAEVYPAGVEAKGVSIFLILSGTVLVSYFTALLASYFTEKGEDVERKSIEKKLDDLLKEVKKIRARN